MRAVLIGLALSALLAICDVTGALAQPPIWYLDGRAVPLGSLTCVDAAGPIPVLELPGRVAVATDYPESVVCYVAGHRYQAGAVDERSATIALAPGDYRIVVPIVMSRLP